MQPIDTAMAKRLVEANAILGASIVGMPGGWGVVVKYGTTESPLAAQRSKKVRMWRSLDSCFAYVRNELGIDRFDGLDGSNHTDEGAGVRQRADTAARMKSAHEAAAHAQWLNDKVAASLADPAPGFTHEQVMADVQAVIDAKRKKHAAKA